MFPTTTLYDIRPSFHLLVVYFIRSSHTLCCDCIWEEFEENQNGNQKPCYSKVRKYNGHKKKVKGHTTIYNTLHRKLSIEQQKTPNQNLFVHTQEKNNKTSYSLRHVTSKHKMTNVKTVCLIPLSFCNQYYERKGTNGQTMI